MDLDQLRTLLAVIDGGSFEAAARAMRVTPSAVSQRIKSLEQQVGRVLVQRSKPAQVTESGQVVMRLARQFDLLERDTRAALDPDSGASTISIPLAANADSLSTWILPALAEVPDVCFDLFREDEGHSTALLRAGTVMAAVTSEPEPVQGCTVTRLGSMRYRAMARPDYLERWLPDGPTPEALTTAPIVLFDRKDELQDRFLRRHSRRVLQPPRHYVPASADFLTAVELGLGWGMLPEIQADDRLGDGRLVELDPGHPIDVPLYWQQWALDSAALTAVADALARAAAARLR